MRAGAGVASITPTPPVYLAGFGARTEPATDVLDDLQARALYLEDADTPLVLVVCDLLGMSSGFSLPVRHAIADRLELDVQNVLLSCTHTHQGPSTIAGSEAIGWPTPEGYADVLRDGCVAAATAARDHAVPATLHYAREPLPDGFAFNRRALPYDEPWFAILDVRGDDGRIALVANLSIHPVLLGPDWYKVATDWVGPFRDALEAAHGGTAIELTGSLGDINPTPPQGNPDDSYAPWATADATRSYGERLAEVVSASVASTAELGEALAIVRAETMDVPVGGTAIAALHGEPTMKVDLVEWDIGGDGRRAERGGQRDQGGDGRRAERGGQRDHGGDGRRAERGGQRDQGGDGRRAERGGQRDHEGVRLVSIPGEAFHLLGREISSARGDRVLLAGIAPAWHGYLPHPWGEGGYEEGVSFGEEFARTVRERLVQAP